MNIIDFSSNRYAISPPYKLPSKFYLFNTIMIKFSIDQFGILRNHGENWITFDPCPHIKSPLQIHVYAYKWLKNIGIVVNFSMNVYFVNLNHICSRNGLVCSVLAYQTLKPGFVSQVSHQKKKYEKYFFDRFLAKTLRINKIAMKNFLKIRCSQSTLTCRSYHSRIKLTHTT